MKKIIFILSFLFGFTSLYSQKLSSNNSKAIKNFNEAIKLYENYNYLDAINKFKKAINIDPLFIEAYILTAQVYSDLNMFDSSIVYYKKTVEIDQDFFPNAYMFIAKFSYMTGKYEEAVKYQELYYNHYKLNPTQRARAKIDLNIFYDALELYKNPVPFKPINLGPNINSIYSEYSPALTIDDSTIIFTRKVPVKDKAMEQEDFYQSKKLPNGNWELAMPLLGELNTPNNEGAHTISADGKILYFTACNRSDGQGSCDIYRSYKIGNTWTKAENVKELNSVSWDSQPTLSADGKTIYFASARNGNMDIYVAHMQKNAKWSHPQPLPDNINTARSELTPFIHPDGKTLFFASDGHGGMGGYDIFYTKKINDTLWTTPQNIGYPINTHKDDAFLFVNASGKYAFFASEIENGYGAYDIYMFEFPKNIITTPVTYFKGIVVDIDDNKPIIHAIAELFSLKDASIAGKAITDIDGSFLLPLPAGEIYALNISAKNYLFYSEHIELIEAYDSLDPFVKYIYLRPIKKDQIMVLNNILFDFDQATLKPESYVELEKLYNFLVDNPNLVIEIGGHTDSIGTKDYNLILSEKRAKAVYDYLISRNINPQRLRYKGYGDTMPIADNSTEEGRKLNRRTEIKILYNN
ncbi:MAG TPA: OmpA family protein [Bacteroidales bacterium]|nr:OmpA family protein [Bacteroidales bacterium]HPZ61330.1 OmpA family protein [Bacteroidales bacterium]HQD58413.1 OmpA family protein [Bacteroidales bacterium]